jgi:hypothetical protein
MRLKVMARSRRQALLLASIDRLGCCSESIGAPISHLHEDQGSAIAHDEVELAVSATVIAGDGLQMMTPQIILGEPLLDIADRPRFRCRVGIPAGAAAFGAHWLAGSESSPASVTPVSWKRPSMSCR